MTGLLIHLDEGSLDEGSPPVLHVGGELDLGTAEQLAVALKDALSASTTVIVDMAEVTFVDAAGLRAILQAAQSQNGSGPLRLVNASRVAWLLEVVGLRGMSCLDLRDGSGTRGG